MQDWSDLEEFIIKYPDKIWKAKKVKKKKMIKLKTYHIIETLWAVNTVNDTGRTA